ncbi:MAG: hypothetical protein PHI34_14765 [Acidobacteriota bacterium]|nr:hypothetical protein [Acidobacteriota bacterium]
MKALRFLWFALGLMIFVTVALWIVPNVSIRSDLTPGVDPSSAFPPAGSPFPNLIENGDFESYFPQSRPRLWQLDPDTLFIWDEFSRGPGDRSLFIDAALIADNAAVRYPLPSLRPGAAYLLSFWLARDHAIDGLYPTVVLGGRSFRLSDFWASGRWQKISLIVVMPRLLPPEACRLEMLIPTGDYRLWIDDIVLRRIDPQAVLLNGRSARPETADLSALRWQLPSTDRLLTIRVAFSRFARGRTDTRVIWTNNIDAEDTKVEVSPRGEKSCAVPITKTILDPLRTTQSPADERAVDPSSEGVDRFEIGFGALAAALPPGRWRARVEFFQYRTLLGRSEPIKIKIEGHSETSRSESMGISPTQALLDSFPIGIYGARLEDFAALREAGFDAVQFSGREPNDLSRAISEASRLGLKLLISPPSAAVAAKPELAGLLADAPVYFYLADEPEGRSQSPKLIYESRAALRRLGFAQPGAIALCRSWRAPDYASAVDIFMSDPYPIPFEPLSWLAECLDEIGSTIAGDPSKRVWAVIQAFPWNVGSTRILTGSGRAPTPAELKALVRMALLHGADGLFFYTLQSGGYRLRDDAPLWQAVKEAIAEARRLKPLLDGPALSPAPTVYCPARDKYGWSAVHFAAVRSPIDGSSAVLALNALDRPVQAALHIPGRAAPIPFALGPLEFQIIDVR